MRRGFLFVRRVYSQMGNAELLAAIKAMQKSSQEHLEKSLDGIGNRLDGFGNRLDGFGNRLDGFGTRLDDLEISNKLIGTRLDGFGTRLDDLEISNKSIVTRLRLIDDKLGALNESMIRDKVAFTRGHSYSKQYTVNSLISSVNWALTVQGLKYDPLIQTAKAFKIARYGQI